MASFAVFTGLNIWREIAPPFKKRRNTIFSIHFLIFPIQIYPRESMGKFWSILFMFGSEVFNITENNILITLMNRINFVDSIKQPTKFYVSTSTIMRRAESQPRYLSRPQSKKVMTDSWSWKFIITSFWGVTLCLSHPRA